MSEVLIVSKTAPFLHWHTEPDALPAWAEHLLHRENLTRSLLPVFGTGQIQLFAVSDGGYAAAMNFGVGNPENTIVPTVGLFCSLKDDSTLTITGHYDTSNKCLAIMRGAPLTGSSANMAPRLTIEVLLQNQYEGQLTSLQLSIPDGLDFLHDASEKRVFASRELAEAGKRWRRTARDSQNGLTLLQLALGTMYGFSSPEAQITGGIALTRHFDSWVAGRNTSRIFN